ncbi:hypothetical protein [Candidatus Cytomitobacter primus]|uniref:Uncharacterized protein n=1 Tax=Candidatus Cytomitobacter primus TaxID=2066024 RepID=A0A5C0UGN0_9PROT|nr:hypothetical protein [Candidatus Cytomitobacter primus]QEK38452.1 hypothetical protein FZC34_00780 [Candidatus Cytomitobacter primus]
MLSTVLVKTSNSMIKAHRDRVTKNNVEKIYRAIGRFVAINGYLPFPYHGCNKYIYGYDKNRKCGQNCTHSCDDPYGSSSFKLSDMKEMLDINKQNSDNIPYTNPSKLGVGIVPFLTLDLQEKDVKDGNGNYFTYAMNIILGPRDGYIYLPQDHPCIKHNTDLVDHDYYERYEPQYEKKHVNQISGFCDVRFHTDNVKFYHMMRNMLELSTRNIYKRSTFYQHTGIEYKADLADLTCWIKTNLHVINNRGYDVSESIEKMHYHINMTMPADKLFDLVKSSDKDKAYFNEVAKNIYYFVRKQEDFQKIYKVCNTIAFVLVSHGPNGGSLDKRMNFMKINDKVSCPHKKENATCSNHFYQSGDVDKGFDDQVFYISKFSLASEYGGFQCRPYDLPFSMELIHNNKYSLA